MKHYAPLFLATLVIACKPSTQTTPQSSLTFTSLASESQEGKTVFARTENAIADESEKWRKGKPEGVTEAFYSCMKKSNYNDLEEGSCASDEKDIQNTRLNKIYKELLVALNEEQSKSLIDAQRAWQTWRNNEELFEQVVYSSEQMDNTELELREMTRLARRADELEHYKANVELRAP